MSATDEPAGHESPFEPEIYEQLRALAHHVMRGERAGHTLAPTALVHEVWLRLADGPGSGYRDAAHFKAGMASGLKGRTNSSEAASARANPSLVRRLE